MAVKPPKNRQANRRAASLAPIERDRVRLVAEEPARPRRYNRHERATALALALTARFGPTHTVRGLVERSRMIFRESSE